MANKLAKEITDAIRDSVTVVYKARGLTNLLSPEDVEDVVRNAAQSIVGVLDGAEAEDACPVCGRCPMCGKQGEHEH